MNPEENGAPLPEEGAKTVVKEGDQTPEESTTSETEAVSETREPITISDEDIEKVYQNNVQKRINKLVAQKSQALEQKSQLFNENQELKNRLAELEKKYESLNKPKEREYSPQDLQRALVKAREDGDYALEIEIQQEIAKSVQRKKEAELEKVQLDQKSIQEQENTIWNNYVVKFPVTDDKDLDINDRGSAIITWTIKLYQKNKEHYDSFGPYRLVQAANDARALILKSKVEKVNNDRAKVLEKKLGREKLKSELGEGGDVEGAGVGVSKDEILEGFNDRSGLFLRARSIKN